MLKISTHTPHARCDEELVDWIAIQGEQNFYSHTSCEVWRVERIQTNYTHWGFLLTHLMRGVTVSESCCSSSLTFLLTHLMRGVTTPSIFAHSNAAISTHTPHARCDLENADGYTDFYSFLLTHLMRGVTYRCNDTRHLYTISTHTPHARCDQHPY